MNELSVKRTPEAVGAEIRSLSAAAKYTTLCYAVEIGRRLVEAKEMVPHGEWGAFLKEQTEFSRSGAGRMMQLFREYGDAKANFPTLGNISVSNALRLLAVPEEERETFAAEVDAEHISSRELEEAIKAREAAERALAEAQSDLILERNNNEGAALKLAELTEQRDAFQSKLFRQASEAQELREQIKELESRPIDVAVQDASEEQIAKARAEGKEEAYEQYTKEQEKLRKEATKAQAALETERNELRKKLEEAQEQLAAPKDTAEEERLIAELEAAKKQLAMSSEGMTVFKLRFAAWQSAYTAMQEAMDSLTEEQRAKCAGAVKAQIGAWA